MKIKIVIKSILSFVILGSMMFLSGCGQQQKDVPYKVSLEIWGTDDGSDVFSPYIGAYKDINPHIKDIIYKKISQETYQEDLIDALASGNGPDIFVVNNAWLPSFGSKMEPSPQGLIGMDKVKENFVDTVANDFVTDSQIYALPLSVDSLALYYNKDLFNSAGISLPPTTWGEFEEDVKKLTKFDQDGKIIQPGAAIGTSQNINRATDILTVLMMQNGVKLISEGGRSSAMADAVAGPDGKTGPLGEVALKYYTQFSNPDSALYTWNNEMHYSIDAFSEGNLGMMFNYSWHVDTIRNKNSKVNFDVASIPQAYDLKKINYSNYWGFGVSKNKSTKGQEQAGGNPNGARVFEAWQFIKYLTMKNSGVFPVQNFYSNTVVNGALKVDPAMDYAEKTKRPAARRDVISKQESDPILGPFAKGNLIAKNWYQRDPEAVEKIMSDMVDFVTKGGTSERDALSWGANKITETLKGR